MEKRVIISTGGTGGHINPAIATAEYLIKNNINVLVIGNDKIEKYLIGKNINYKVIKCGSTLKSFKSLFNIFFGFLQSLKLIFSFKPQVIIGFGSYTTLPVLLASKFTKKSILLHEGNSFIGKINNFFLKDAEYLFTSFQEIYGIKINYSNKIYFTGVPIKEEIRKLYNNEYFPPKKNEKFKILITSGSGGASFFSDAFLEVFDYFDKNIKNNLKIYHQVKIEEELEKVKSFYDNLNIENEVKMFFDDMPEKILESHLVICRSGIGTASELAIIGRPVIFFPSPNVTNDHQLYNANFYKKNDAALVFEEKYFIAKEFSKTLLELIKNNEQLISLAKNIKTLAVLDAEERIFKIVDEICIREEIKQVI